MKILKEWLPFFEQEIIKPYWNELKTKIETEKLNHQVFPQEEDVFRLFSLIKPKDVKVVIIGQDPYHGLHQANGIAFSVSNQVNTPPSLKNIFKELQEDLQVNHYSNNDLSGWVEQGVFLINTCLTVNQSLPGSHQNFGWEIFVKNCLEYLNKKNDLIIYVLFGKWAKNTYNNLQAVNKRSFLIESGHPSPFSYEKYFKGTKPFSKINQILVNQNYQPIDWSK